ncbi:MAG TPA: tetratricopeptide repeat protein [Fimbriimonadaceae bacterium]|jgi:tetratricopeptide (TPR) repeat protein
MHLLSPNSGDPMLLAQQEFQAGRFFEAEEICRNVVLSNPQHLQALLFLGTMEAKNGKPDDGANTLRKLLTIEPKCFEAYNWLAAILREQGKFDEAVDCCKKAATLQPADPETHQNLGLTLFAAGRFGEAAQSFRNASSCGPGNPSYSGNLGAALEASEDLDGAEKAYLQALARDPNNWNIAERLGLLLSRMGKNNEAIIWLQRVVEANPNNVPALMHLAQCHTSSQRFEEAHPLLERAISIDPNLPAAYGMMGSVAMRFGKFDDANIYFDKAIEMNPDQVGPYYERFIANKVTEENRPLLIRAIEMAQEDRGFYDLRLLEYGIAKALNDLGEYENAIAHYDRANKLSKSIYKDRHFSTHKHSKQADLIISTFSKNFLKCNSHLGNPSDTPIIVCGMPRSGTTLLAQILSSHSLVGAAGEQKFWTGHAKDVWITGTRLDPAAVRELTHEYLEHLQHLCPGKKHVVDKMPQNYMVAGLIHLALPNAKIIHVRRNPVDTCLSIYFAAFQDPMDFCHDREHIVAAYRSYQRVMAHWREVLPTNRFMEVDYEELIGSQRPMTKKVTEFCGLEWDEACMFPERNQRLVTTASLWQARQPVYKASLERWRRYEPWLGAFSQLLEPERLEKAA